MFDWCANDPENGFGLELIQFHPSPKPVTVAPVGTLSSTQISSGVVLTVFPARSHVTRPPYALKAMPLTVLPSSPSTLAATSSRTHCPLAGSAPTNVRLTLVMLSAPQ